MKYARDRERKCCKFTQDLFKQDLFTQDLSLNTTATILIGNLEFALSRSKPAWQALERGREKGKLGARATSGESDTPMPRFVRVARAQLPF